MVFNKYYDRSLLLMMLGDKDNNKMIINFLKFMPENMHKYIRKLISLNSHMAIYGDFRTIKFDTMQMLNNDGFIYNLNVMMDHGVLIIDLHRYHMNMDVDEKINLSLQPLRSYDLEKNINIGSFSYELDMINTFSDKRRREIYSRKYDIKQLPFDIKVVISKNKNISKLVPVNFCFGYEELSLESLFSDSRFNNDSKKRVLNNKKKRI